MVDEIINLNPQAEGSNTAANRNRNAVIRTPELAVERELENLKNKVAEKGNNESFLEFEKKSERIKEVFKNRSLGSEWKIIQEEKEYDNKFEKVIGRIKRMSERGDMKSTFEKTVDVGLREIIPFYGSFTKADREKQLETIIEYYQEQFSQLTTSIANDQENIFSEVKNVLKEKNRKIDGMTKVIDQLKEQAEAEKEERKKEKTEREREKKANEEEIKKIEKAKGEKQKELQSAERVEIERLRSESNRVNKTTQELENGLKAWIRAYDQLKLEKQIVINEWETLYLNYENRGHDLEIKRKEAEQLRSDKIALGADNTGYKEEISNLNKDIKEAKDKIKELESDKATLEAQVTDLEIEKKDWKEKYEKQKQQKRIGLIANVAQGAIEWLPIPEKWQGGLKTSIQAASMWALWKDLPNWTYEGLIMVVGVGLWYAIIHILRKINRVIFGRKDKKHVSNLEKALTNIIEAGSISKKKKEPSSPAVVSKEPVTNGEISPQISDEKTDPIREEKAEVEKPAKESKNGKKAKKKKNKKKVKGDSS